MRMARTKIGGRKIGRGRGHQKDLVADELTVDVDVDVATPAAEASRKAIAKEIKKITRLAKPATIERRKRKPSAGRYPTGSPGGAGSNALFNDSGYLANSLEVRKVSQHESVVMVPPRRLGSDLGNKLNEVLEQASDEIDLDKAARSPGISRAVKRLVGKMYRIKRLKR